MTNEAKRNEELNQPPCSLFLQWHGDSDPEEWVDMPEAEEVTWAAHRIWSGDSQYIRADLVREMHEAAGKRMMADDPSGEERVRFLKSWQRIGDILENIPAEPRPNSGHSLQPMVGTKK